jgi:hypothetical protein
MEYFNNICVLSDAAATPEPGSEVDCVWKRRAAGEKRHL